MQGYKVMVQLDDWDRSIEEYDGVIYEKVGGCCQGL